MKAEEILKHNLNPYSMGNLTSSIIKAMQEYARDQIIKDRKRIKEAYYDETNQDTFNDLIKGTPIILD